MNDNYLREDKSSAHLPVRFSKKISNKINSIVENNAQNADALNKWLDYLDWIKNHISTRTIAWDYANQHIKFPNGTRFISKFNIGYTVKCDRAGAYVYVFLLDLKLEEFGLKIIDSISECYPSDIRPKEISKETLYRIMSEQYERYLYSLF